MWPYTHDESNWLGVIAVLETTQPSPILPPPSLAELEVAARRYRSYVIGRSMALGLARLGRLLRGALYRRRRVDAKPPKNAVGAD